MVKLGRSFENVHPVTRGVARAHARISSATTVRDLRSSSVVGSASVIPDLALGAFDPAPRPDEATLVVSFRDRDADAEALASRARAVAGSLGLTPVVVSQVEFDTALAHRLAGLLDARVVDLVPAAKDSLARAGEVYGSASAVLSDRLHALLFGVAHGAAPLLPSRPAVPKAEAALATIGLEPVDLADLASFDLAAARVAARAAADDARVRLDAARTQFRALVGGRA